MRSIATRVIAFVVITGFLGALIAITVANFQIRPTNTYSAVFDDVSGLKSGQDVRAAGVNIGRVNSVGLRGNQALVSFTVDTAVPLTTTTDAAIRWKNLIGDRFIELSQPPGAASILPPGARIPVSRTSPALDLDQLSNGFRPLFQGLDPAQTNELSGEVIQVLQGQGPQLDALFTNLGQFTAGLARKDAAIGDVIDNLDVVLGGLAEHHDDLANLVVQSDRLVSGLSNDRRTILDSVNRLNHATDTVADLLHRVRPDVRSDVWQIQRLAELVNRNQAQVNASLRALPPQLTAELGASANGSYLNAYVCGVQIKTTGPTGAPVFSPFFTSSAPRCQPR
jgi:phospholipid/cholesterol/gamma-HCH transport system substrate-binding protein